jgi:hypothetical protein
MHAMTQPLYKRPFCLIRGIILLSAFLFLGCSPESDVNHRLTKLEEQISRQTKLVAEFDARGIEQINTNISAMGNSLAELFTKLESELRLEMFKLKQEVVPQRFAILDPTSKGYSLATTDKGVFLFSVDKAEPYLDGHKIFLRIGNLANATFSGFKLGVSYSKQKPIFPAPQPGSTNEVSAFAEFQKERQIWLNSIRSTEISFADELQPGAWNVVDFTLKDTKPDQIAHLEVELKLDQLKLRKASQDLLRQ